MPSRPRSLNLAARYVFPVEEPPIADGLVSIEDGRITRVGPIDGRRYDIDLGNVAIIPGLVNAHTHLELSSLDGESGGVEDQVEWLARVVRQRRSGDWDSLHEAARVNLSAALRAGTTLLADTATAGSSWSYVAAAPVRGVVFAELIGLKRSRGLDTQRAAWTWIGSVKPEDQVTASARPGLAPHAPYSTSPWLYYHSATCRLPLSTHLAELPEETELLCTRRGRLREFLESIDAWDDEWEPIGARPADYVRKGDLRQADWLIAHGNYLDPDEFWQLLPDSAPSGQRVAVAYCPRTHSRFGHAPHPYRTMLERGVIVCLGTDSLASAPSLSILDEMRYLHAHDPALSGRLLLTMATLFGAWALRAETVTGSLAPGKSADLAIVGLPDREADDPHALLLDSDLPVVATVFEGEFTFGPWSANGD